jgi:hypothetical protein
VLSYSRNLLESEDGGENSEINPYQENSFFFVGVICPMWAVKGELEHPSKLWQAVTAKSMQGSATRGTFSAGSLQKHLDSGMHSKVDTFHGAKRRFQSSSLRSLGEGDGSESGHDSTL